MKKTNRRRLRRPFGLHTKSTEVLGKGHRRTRERLLYRWEPSSPSDPEQRSGGRVSWTSRLAWISGPTPFYAYYVPAPPPTAQSAPISHQGSWCAWCAWCGVLGVLGLLCLVCLVSNGFVRTMMVTTAAYVRVSMPLAVSIPLT